MTLTKCWCRNVSKQARKVGRAVTKKTKQEKPGKILFQSKMLKILHSLFSCALSRNLGVQTVSHISRTTSPSYKISPPMNSPCCCDYEDMYSVECSNVSVVLPPQGEVFCILMEAAPRRSYILPRAVLWALNMLTWASKMS